MKKEEFINRVNSGNYPSLIDVYDTFKGQIERVSEHQNIDEHRWYSLAVDVYKLENGFVGVSGVYQSFSEMQTLEDIKVYCTAFSMKAVQSVKYVKE